VCVYVINLYIHVCCTGSGGPRCEACNQRTNPHAPQSGLGVNDIPGGTGLSSFNFGGMNSMFNAGGGMNNNFNMNMNGASGGGSGNGWTCPFCSRQNILNGLLKCPGCQNTNPYLNQQMQPGCLIS